MTAHEAIAATKKELKRRIKRCRENGFGSHASALEKFHDEYFLKLEAKSKISFCAENCIGFRQTGKCFADGECEAKREADKRLDKVLTNDEVKTIIEIYDKHCCECGFGLWDRMKHKDAIAKEVCKRFNNLGKNSK